MKCPKCNCENTIGEKFCRYCNYPLPEKEIEFKKPPKKAWYKRWWIWAIIGVVTISSIGMFAGRRSDGTSMFEQPRESETATESTEPKPTERTAPYTVGETYDDEGLELHFISSDDYDYPESSAPDKGFKVVRVGIEIKNNDSNSRYFGEKYFKCYADNKPTDIWYSYEDGLHRLAYNDELSPGREFEGFLYFEVPEDALTIEIEYEPISGLLHKPKPIILKVK